MGQLVFRHAAAHDLDAVGRHILLDHLAQFRIMPGKNTTGNIIRVHHKTSFDRKTIRPCRHDACSE